MLRINNNIKKLRELSGKSQQQMADILGIKRTTYANWETNTEPELTKIMELAKIFGVHYTELIDNSESSDTNGELFPTNNNNMAKATILKKLLQKLDLNVDQFEKEIGVGHSAVAKAIARNTSISDNLIRKILKRYRHVNEQWLMTGVGEPLLKDTITNNSATLMDNTEQQDWKQAHMKLLDAQNIYAQSHQVLSSTIYELTRILQKVDSIQANLSDARKDQQGYQIGIAANQEVMEGALEKLLKLPDGDLVKKADTLQNERMKNIAKTDTVGA